MDRLWVIARKEIRTRFSDRHLLIIMLLAPLAISTIIGLAFSGIGRSSSPIRDIKVAVVNHDQPGTNGVPFGSLMSGLLTGGQIPGGIGASATACPQGGQDNSTNSGGLTLGELIQGTVFNQLEAQSLVGDKTIAAPTEASGSPEYVDAAARAAVDKGKYAAVVIIPAGYSAALDGLSDPRQAPAAAAISVYGNAGDSLSAGIVRSVVESLSSQMVSGNIAVGATIQELAETQPEAIASLSTGTAGQVLNQVFLCAFVPGNDLVKLTDTPVQATPVSAAATILVTIGSAQALFFALFTGQFGILSMYEERTNWTLQRMVASPTPRWSILGGKLVGVFVSVVFQLVLLVLALTLVGGLLEGHPVFIWGNNLPLLVALILAVSIAVSGLGMLLAGVLKGIEQANIVMSVLNIALGVLGGAFGFQLPATFSSVSFIYWARSAFDTLAAGRGDVTINLLVLVVQGVAFFAIGLVLFNRKFEV